MCITNTRHARTETHIAARTETHICTRTETHICTSTYSMAMLEPLELCVLVVVAGRPVLAGMVRGGGSLLLRFSCGAADVTLLLPVILLMLSLLAEGEEGRALVLLVVVVTVLLTAVLALLVRATVLLSFVLRPRLPQAGTGSL